MCNADADTRTIAAALHAEFNFVFESAAPGHMRSHSLEPVLSLLLAKADTRTFRCIVWQCKFTAVPKLEHLRTLAL